MWNEVRGADYKNQAWWHALVILVLGRLGKVDPWGLLAIQPSLISKFQATEDYIGPGGWEEI